MKSALTQNSIRLSTLAVLAWGLMGCQGQNPFQSESNPTAKYPHAAAANQKYVPGDIKTAAPPPDNTQLTCRESLKVTADNSEGSTLNFSEDATGKFRITVSAVDNSKLTYKNLEIAKPKDATISNIKNEESSTSFDLNWRPVRTRNNSLSGQVLSVTLESDVCGKATESLNLVVGASASAPTLEFQGVPQNTIEFGTSFDFAVIVEDSGATAEHAPTLAISFIKDRAYNGERWVMNAADKKTPAVDCKDEAQSIGGNKFQFACNFNSNNISESDLKLQLGSDRSVDAVFFATATSARASESKKDLTSGAMPKFVKVHFPKTAAPAPAAPEVKAEPVQQAPAAAIAPVEESIKPASNSKRPKATQTKKVKGAKS